MTVCTLIMKLKSNPPGMVILAFYCCTAGPGYFRITSISIPIYCLISGPVEIDIVSYWWLISMFVQSEILKTLNTNKTKIVVHVKDWINGSHTWTYTPTFNSTPQHTPTYIHAYIHTCIHTYIHLHMSAQYEFLRF